MNKNFLAKLTTNKYLIGSFDIYQDISKKLMIFNSKISEEEADKQLKNMPEAYRASILDKSDIYVGYIGVYNLDESLSSASIRLEVKNESIDKNEILNEYENYLEESLNIHNIIEIICIDDKKKECKKNLLTSPTTNIILPNKMLLPGITKKILSVFSNEYNIPKLQFPFTIVNKDKIIGIIGLSDLIWSNRRANLNIYLNKSLGQDIIYELSGYLINEYLDYIHHHNIHNLTFSVCGSNNDMIDIINNTNMNYYGAIPYGFTNGKLVESKFMFQHIPGMKKNDGIELDKNDVKNIEEFSTSKTELSKVLELGNGLKLIVPSVFKELNINTNKIIDGYTNAMQDRKNFTIPLGEDKYVLQKGDGTYGLSKHLMSYSYVLMDEDSNYLGYVNTLRKNGKNAEIEIGIAPTLQHKGIGTLILNKFYEELFSIGYASVTSAVFEFNNSSINLHEKIAQLNGVRLEAYYINGKMWNMNFYSKVNQKNLTKKVLKK